MLAAMPIAAIRRLARAPSRNHKTPEPAPPRKDCEPAREVQPAFPARPKFAHFDDLFD